MRPAALRVEGYRGFRDAQTVELRPLTVIFGANNAGKSALIRALPLISDSLSRKASTEALVFDDRLGRFEIDLGALSYKGEPPATGLTLGLAFEGGVVTDVDWVVGDRASWGRPVVEELLVRGIGHTTLYAAERVTVAAERRLPAVSMRRDGVVAPVQFAGLRPVGLAGEVGAFFDRLRFDVSWLTASRRSPSRLTPIRGAPDITVAPDGTNAPLLLFDRPDVFALVHQWYAHALDLELGVAEEGSTKHVRVTVRPRSRLTFWLDMIDAGEGVGQVLSVVTALATARLGADEAPNVVAIEEPETHLHKDVLRALVEEMVLAAAVGRSSIVIETHSPTVLATVQLAMARASLTRDQVALYWVGAREGVSAANLVELDALGRFIGPWPPDALREDQAVYRELQAERERLERE